MKKTIQHITLIRPPYLLPRFSFTTSAGTPPIGLAYIAGGLKVGGYEVELIDAFGEAPKKFTRMGTSELVINGLLADDIVSRIPKKTSLIGISCMFSNEWIYHKKVVKDIIAAFPDVPVVMGGEHTTACYNYIFKHCPQVLACIIGEGDETLLELIHTLNNGERLNSIKGIVFQNESGQLKKNPQRKRIADINKIPWPDWDKVPLANYLEQGLGMGAVRGRNMPMVLSRGCPFKCTFCSNSKMWQSKWFIRSVEDVIAEMKFYKNKFNINNFEFYDLTAIVKKNWMLDFIKKLENSQLNVTWSMPSGTRSEALDEEVVAKLYHSGCHSLVYAPESGSKTTLKRIQKTTNLNNMLDSMKASVKHRIHVKANMVIGFPDESIFEVFKSYIFIIRMSLAGVHDVPIFPFVPYPGSKLYDKLYKDGKTPQMETPSDFEMFLAGNVYNEVGGMKSWSEHITDKEIKVLSITGMGMFYFFQYLFRPWRLLQSLLRLMRGKPTSMMEKMVDGVIKRHVSDRLNLFILKS